MTRLEAFIGDWTMAVGSGRPQGRVLSELLPGEKFLIERWASRIRA